jgi:hypothetical protein
MATAIQPGRIDIRPGASVDIMATIRSVLEDRPMGGTIADFRKCSRILDELDRVAAGEVPDLIVEPREATMLAGLLEAQQWRTLARPLMRWVEDTIARLRADAE